MNSPSSTIRSNRLGWVGFVIATLAILLVSHLILYPQPTPETLLLALRVTSLTTAIPLWLVFVAQPIALVASEVAHWIQANRRYLWLTLTASHLMHRYQIGLYYQVGQQCPLIVWLVTLPVWIVLVIVAAIEWVRPQWLTVPATTSTLMRLRSAYWLGLGYVWLIFTLAFGLGAIARHLPFYNIPALLLFLAGGALHVMGWLRRAAAPPSGV
ncbi:MAG: hypothetical protein ACTS2F_14845 [Thainema sp.]